MSLQNVTTDELLQHFTACLENGIENEDNRGYIAEKGAYVLFIDPDLGRIDTFSLGYPVVTLQFATDSKTWEEIETHSAERVNAQYHAKLYTLQQEVEKKRGEHRVKIL